MTKMLSRVFKSRFPKTVQFRRFCQPSTSKNELNHHKIKSNPETLKNDLDVMGKHKKEEEDDDFLFFVTIWMLLFAVVIQNKKKKQRKNIIENNNKKRKQEKDNNS